MDFSRLRSGAFLSAPTLLRSTEQGHENGLKQEEGTYKDGKKVSAKYWNSQGESVETEKETFK